MFVASIENAVWCLRREEIEDAGENHISKDIYKLKTKTKNITHMIPCLRVEREMHGFRGGGWGLLPLR